MSVGFKIVGFALATLVVCLVWFGLTSRSISAQHGPVWHDVASWNDDGTVTASVSMDLPSTFADADGSVTAWVVCDVPGLCHKAPVSIDASESNGVVGSFSMPLSPGDTPLTVTLSVNDGSGEDVLHKTQEYVAVVPAPISPKVEYMGYEISEVRGDGTANAVLTFVVDHQDEWPMYNFSAHAECEDDTECSGSMNVTPGWWDTDNPGTRRQSSTPHLVYLAVNGLEQGVRELSLEVRDSDERWLGSTRVTRLSGISVSVPTAKSLHVEFLGSELTGYNDNQTANLFLKFMIRRTDAWPYTSTVASFECGGEMECEYERVMRPGWGLNADPKGQVIRLPLESVPVGEVNISARFELLHEQWSGPERVTVLDGVLAAVPQQPEFDVRWRTDSAEVVGYYMDGSALVNLTTTLWDLGYGDGFSGLLTGYCVGNGEDEGDDNECIELDTATEIQVGNEESTVELHGLRLPQGDITIRFQAGSGSGKVSVSVPAKAVGISRDLWDCFNDTLIEFGPSCSGFDTPVVRKWEMKTVNVYREGDPLYIEIFDSALDTITDITNIEYVIVDDRSSAHVEAYVGHEGHPIALELFGEGCAFGPGCAYHFQEPGSPHALIGARLSVGKRQPDWRDEAITLEEEIRFTTLHELLHVLIPVGHDNRPFAPSLVEKPSYMRKSDTQMYRMIYTPGVESGMSFDDLLEFAIFDDETIDYVPSEPEPEFLVRRAIRALYDADSIKLSLTGMDVRGSVRYPGPTLEVQYAGLMTSSSQMVKFSSRSWDSIIFGYDAESWSSAGGIWTISKDHRGRARDYRGHVKFDFILADPVPLLRYHLFAGEDLIFAKRGDGTFVIRSTSSAMEGASPKPTVEIVIDPKSGEMSSYAIEWQFEPNSRYRYRVKADVVSYGDEFEIPDEVRENSEYLKRLDSQSDEQEVEVEIEVEVIHAN